MIQLDFDRISEVPEMWVTKDNRYSVFKREKIWFWAVIDLLEDGDPQGMFCFKCVSFADGVMKATAWEKVHQNWTARSNKPSTR